MASIFDKIKNIKSPKVLEPITGEHLLKRDKKKKLESSAANILSKGAVERVTDRIKTTARDIGETIGSPFQPDKDPMDFRVGVGVSETAGPEAKTKARKKIRELTLPIGEESKEQKNIRFKSEQYNETIDRILSEDTESALTTPSVAPYDPEKSEVRLPYSLKEVEIPVFPVDKIANVAFRLSEIIPKAATQMVQNYREMITGTEVAEPIKGTPLLDPRKIGFDEPAVYSTGYRLIEKFEELEAENPSKTEEGLWLNAVKSSFSVAIPDTFDAFIAGSQLNMLSKIALRKTGFDPRLNQALDDLSLPKNKEFTVSQLKNNFVKKGETFLKGGDTASFNQLADDVAYIAQKGTTEGIPTLGRMGQTIQKIAKELIRPRAIGGRGLALKGLTIENISNNLPDDVYNSLKKSNNLEEFTNSLNNLGIRNAAEDAAAKLGFDTIEEFWQEYTAGQGSEDAIERGVDFYFETGGYAPGEEKPNAGLKQIERELRNPDGRVYAKETVDKAIEDGKIELDDDGKVTLYRAGEPSEVNNLVSATYDKSVAQTFIDSAESQGKDVELYEFKADPREIELHIGEDESEVLMDRGVLENKITGKTSVRQLRKYGKGEQPSGFVTKRETTLLKDRVRNYSRGWREGRSLTKKEITDFQNRAKDLVYNSNIKPKDYKKFINSINKIDSANKFYKNKDKIVDRIDRIENRIRKNEAIDRLRKSVSDMDTDKMRPEFKKEIQNILDDVDVANTSKNKLQELKSTKQFLKDNPDNDLPENVVNELEKLEKKQLRDLSADEIENINKTISYVRRANETKNKLIFKGKVKDFVELRDKAITHLDKGVSTEKKVIETSDVKEMKGKLDKLKDTFGLNSLGGEDIAEMLEGSEDPYGLDDIVKEAKTGEVTTRTPMEEVFYRGFHRGTETKIEFEQEVNNHFQNIAKNNNIILDKKGDAWSEYLVKNNKHVYKDQIELDSGKILPLSRGKKLKLVLLSERDEGLKKLLKNGFSPTRESTAKLKITEDDIQRVKDSLTEKERTMLNGIREYYDFTGDRINEVSTDLMGYEIATEDNYTHITTNRTFQYRNELAKNTTPTNMKNFYKRTLEGMGIFKDPVEHSQPIVLTDIFEDIAKHTEKVGSYIAYAEPLRNSKQMLYDTKFQKAVKENYGKNYWKELKDFVQDMEGQSVDLDNISQLGLETMQKVDMGVFALNLPVYLYQPISYIAANLEVSIGSLLKGGIRLLNRSRIKAEMIEHSPIATDRFKGSMNRVAGAIKGMGKVRNMFTGKTSYSQKAFKPMHEADFTAVGRLWEAVKSEVSSNYPDLSQKEFWEVVNKRWDHVVRKTQPTFFREDRSKLGRQKDLWHRISTRYMTVRNKLYRRVFTQTHRYLNSGKTIKDKAKLLKNLSLITFITSGFITGVKKIKKYLTRGKMTTPKEFVIDTFVNTASLPYFMGTISQSILSKIRYGIYGGWDVTNPLARVAGQFTTAFAQSIKSANEIAEKPEEWKDETLKALDSVAEVLTKIKGVPFENAKDLYQMGESGYNWITTGDMTKEETTGRRTPSEIMDSIESRGSGGEETGSKRKTPSEIFEETRQ